jgi:hypothetical protein
MNSSTEERVPGIVHFADFVFGGSVLRTSFIRSEITRGSTTGWFKQARQSAAQPVRLSAASDSVAYCDITTVKPPDFVPDPHRASGCVTAPGVWPLPRPTIWLITNHRPHCPQISFPSRNMSIAIPASSTPQPGHCAALACRLGLLTKRDEDEKSNHGTGFTA